MSARILIVDDIQANLDILSVKLELRYYEVMMATRGEIALDLAKTRQPDLIILDVMMPGMDGFEVCQRLKSMPETQHIPVVMLTALSDRESKQKGLESGADDFLSKPIQDTSLFTRIKSLLRLKMTMDESYLRVKLSEEISGEKIVSLQEIDASGALVYLFADHVAEARNIQKALVVDQLNVQMFSNFAELEINLIATPPELIILDLHHEDADMLHYIAHLRARVDSRSLPLFGIADHETEVLSQALDLGLNDYAMRPLDPYEVCVRARGQIKRWRYHLKLVDHYRENISFAYIDPLTSVYNRRYAFSHLENLQTRLNEFGKSFSLLMIDVDNFKIINDTEGHQKGDEVLKDIAYAIKDSVRNFDLVARVGGEEFIVILPETDAETAQKIADRMCKKISVLSITVSIGVIQAEKDVHVTRLMSQLDQALYDAKHQGGNCVCRSII